MLLVLLVFWFLEASSVPLVLPGSNVTNPLNFGDICQSRYLYPPGYALGEDLSILLVFFVV